MAVTLAEIVGRVITPDTEHFPPEVAKFFLGLELKQSDHDRMQDLGVKANRGTLTADEARELDSYLDVCLALGILKSKSRLSLRSTSAPAA
jgi:phosphoribosyl 1,2-cyclic phosphodiesterase